MKNQLKDRGIETSLPAILEEIAKIRHELGYPVMATPFSQWFGGLLESRVGLALLRSAGGGELLERVVDALDVGGMVLAVVQLHDFRGDVGGQCPIVVVEVREGVGHS